MSELFPDPVFPINRIPVNFPPDVRPGVVSEIRELD
jgi:hypothetical protein